MPVRLVGAWSVFTAQFLVSLLVQNKSYYEQNGKEGIDGRAMLARLGYVQEQELVPRQRS